MKSDSNYIQLIRYLDGVIDEEKQVQHDPFMFTRIMARLEDQKQLTLKNKFQIALQTITFIAIIAIGIYSGILVAKNFTNQSFVSVDYQNEIYYLDELQHENMISVLLSD